ncbi:hypothetical protein SERLA73DRAFT_191143 [Serpula lacrymans var. lacrymans S7.3]|uniref:UEV domain-containing protein n=1 Tax=Serpula lacrymans var. lacrymans (strain S7.3) TaxID=936435 RepID=F8QGZ2_SERL3|nr:hypothetical protein SERLA73DRAFT_191143 [Serpula lacrymans var. lacrymans S7.3]
MSTESLTQKWLRQNVHPYPQKDRVFVDIDAALTRYNTLRPKSDVYTYDDGRTQLLLCVHGLLPISYRGASYNIPIAVWIPREYPRLPPIAYVVPTQDMLVKASKNVDVSGRCHIEYIRNWEKKNEACNLSILLETMQEEFSRGPPLYAKPINARIASPQNPAQPPSRSSMLSSSTTTSTPSSISPPVAHHDRPILPPKPSSSTPLLGVPSTASSIPSSSSTLSSAQADLGHRPPPPLPPHPYSDVRPPQYEHSRGPQFTRRDPYGSNIPHAHSSPPPPTIDNYRWSTPSHPIYQPTPHDSIISPPLSTRPTGPVSAGAQTVPFPPPKPWSPPMLAPKPTGPPPNLLEEEAPDASIVAPKAPVVAPPRPPNPELLRLHAQVHSKLTSELASVSQVMAIDAERLRAQQTDLLAGEPAIRDEMARLEAVRDVCRNVAGRLRSTVEQGERNVSELRRKGDPEVDELICSTSIVHNQLVNLVAEDNAIEDTIYHLHRALNTGRVDLERFLRTTRVLAEEQFTKRALMEKIQTGMPMGMSLGYN